MQTYDANGAAVPGGRFDEVAFQHAAIQRIRLSLLARERALLPSGAASGLVLDLYGSVLTETEAAQRVVDLVLVYMPAAWAWRRGAVVPVIDPDLLVREGIAWSVNPGLDSESLGRRVKASGSWLPEKELLSLSRFAGIIVKAATAGPVYTRLGAALTMIELYRWWFMMCDVVGVVTE